LIVVRKNTQDASGYNHQNTTAGGNRIRGDHQTKGKIAMADNSESNIRIDEEHFRNGN
jgi:hypothetical protein